MQYLHGILQAAQSIKGNSLDCYKLNPYANTKETTTLCFTYNNNNKVSTPILLQQ